MLYDLGVEHGMVIHCAGLDELNPIGIADIVEITQVRQKIISLEKYTNPV